MKSLTELANLYGSDKGTLGPSLIWGSHNYTDVYEGYFSHMRHRPIFLLEIGLGVDGPGWQANIQHGRNPTGGASAKLWRDYFPRGSIVGMDINPAPHLDGERLRTVVLDQGDPRALEQLPRETGIDAFDVIIDDGSHKPEHQQISLSVLFAFLKPGGLYFIEDLAANGCRDGASGRSASADVLNTRSVLAGFREHEHFPTPNALLNETELRGQIESVTFHCPKSVRRLIPRAGNWRRPIARVLTFATGTERLCAIRRVSRTLQ